MDINFGWQGKSYTVDRTAYDADKIVLPDGTLLKVSSWQEIEPPIPMGIKEVPHVFARSTPSDIAKNMGAVVAKEAE